MRPIDWIARTGRMALSCGLLAGLLGAVQAAEIRDNFDDGDAAGWTVYDVFASAGVVSRFDPIGGGLRIVTTNSPAVAFGPVVGGLVRTQANWADFTVKVDFRNWTQGAGTNTTVGVLGRVSFPTATTVNAYMATVYTGRLPFVQRGYPVSPVLLIERLDGSVKNNFGFEILPDLDPEKTYTLEFSGEGRSFLARLYEAGRPDRTLALTRADDNSATIHTSGAVGILAMNRDTTAGFPDGPVQATFDNFEANDSGLFVAPEPPQIAPVFADDFNDGDDRGWVRVDPYRAQGVTNAFDLSGGVYRMSSPPAPATNRIGQVGAYVDGANWSDFRTSVDFTGWTVASTTNLYITLTGRFTPGVGGTNDFYGLRVVHGGSALLTGTSASPFLTIDRWKGGVRSTFSIGTLPALQSSQWYRMVFEGRGSFLRGWLYSLSDLTRPICFVAIEDRELKTGSVGLMLLDRFGVNRSARSSGTSLAWDNFQAWGVQKVEDPFADGNDAGWQHYEPFGLVGVKGGFAVEDGAYRVSHPPSPFPALAPAVVGALRDDVNWSDFDFEVDVSGWGTGARVSSSVLLAARSSRNADGTVNGYGLTFSPTATPELEATGLFTLAGLTIDVIQGSRPAGASLSFGSLPTLDPAKWYRLRFTGRGTLLTGEVRERGNADILAMVQARDSRRYAGGIGLVALDRAGLGGIANNGVTVLFDNVVAAGVDALAPVDPELNLVSTVSLDWPATVLGWALETAGAVEGPWQSAGVTPTLVGGRATAVVPVGGGAQFFRLRKP